MEYSLKITSAINPRDFLRELLVKLSFTEIESVNYNVNDDILLNYTDKSIIDKLSGIITDWIISKYKPELIKQYIKNCFADDMVQYNSQIFDKSVKSTLILDEIYSKRIIVKKLTDYINNHSELSLKGFVNFRISEYRRLMESVIFDAIDEICVEKEYNEFLELLKTYIENSASVVDLLHVYVSDNLKISLYDFKMQEIEVKLEDMDSTEFFLTKDDLLTSVLISLAPKRIIWHNNINFKNTSLINTLKQIFGERFYLCNGCSLIKH